MVGKLTQFGTALMAFCVSTIIAWYEGSALLEKSSEWKYSAPFSQWMNESVVSSKDISQLDFFVYAVKFHPNFPLVMLVSALYLFVLIGYYFLKTKFLYYLSILGFILLGISLLIMDSPTMGGGIIFSVCLLGGLLLISYSILALVLKRKRLVN
jgi:hypothetical protein